jgi:serine/threonine protein kinase
MSQIPMSQVSMSGFLDTPDTLEPDQRNDGRLPDDPNAQENRELFYYFLSSQRAEPEPEARPPRSPPSPSLSDGGLFPPTPPPAPANLDVALAGANNAQNRIEAYVSTGQTMQLELRTETGTFYNVDIGAMTHLGDSAAIFRAQRTSTIVNGVVTGDAQPQQLTLKIYHRTLSHNENTEPTALREFKLGRFLMLHPDLGRYVVATYGVVRFDRAVGLLPVWGLLQEQSRGISLHNYASTVLDNMRNNRFEREKAAARLGARLAAAVYALNSEGIYHQNLRPENVYVLRGLNNVVVGVHLLNFAAACVNYLGPIGGDNPVTTCVNAGDRATYKGTIGYTDPETLNAEPQTHKLYTAAEVRRMWGKFEMSAVAYIMQYAVDPPRRPLPGQAIVGTMEIRVAPGMHTHARQIWDILRRIVVPFNSADRLVPRDVEGEFEAMNMDPKERDKLRAKERSQAQRDREKRLKMQPQQPPQPPPQQSPPPPPASRRLPVL